MRDTGEPRVIVLYDSDCGFCKVMLAMLLSSDRASRLTPVPIESARGDELLSQIAPSDRISSWHLIDEVGILRSGGAAVPAALRELPHGEGIAWVTARFPRATSGAYDWVADHRALLGRLFGKRPRAWADRVIAKAARAR
jgi:predicted DCC family thiol-disulfide oxidoreductase YuxK